MSIWNLQRLWKAGCFAIVLECVPPVIAAAITKAIDIPTIGIGAGPHCSGQVGQHLILDYSGTYGM